MPNRRRFPVGSLGRPAGVPRPVAGMVVAAACLAQAIAIAACTSVDEVATPTSERPSPPTAMTPMLLKTRACLLGAFTSSPHADSDPNVRAVVRHVVPIWTDRVDGPWLYVEMATAEHPMQPYQRRIDRLLPIHAANGRDAVLLLPHRLPGDGEVSGSLWRTPERLDAFAPGELEPMEGCGVTLRADGVDRIHGTTSGQACTGGSRDAAFTTIDLELSKTGCSLLERGFDADGRQVSGPEHGPVRFSRVKSLS